MGENQAFLSTLRVLADTTHKPRTALQLTLQQLQRLADDFDLGRIIQMDEPFNTQCNTTEPFRTGQGTFLLRARHGEEYVERLEFLHRTIDSLVASGFCCPAVIRARSGKSWTVWGERLVEVHQFIEHDSGTHRDWGRMNAAASALGDLHAALAACVKGRSVVPPEMRNDISPRQCLLLLEEVKRTIHQRSDDDALEAARVCAEVESLVHLLAQDYERIVGNLPWLIVHGDYHFWNILYKADQIVGVVDYDFLQERERMFDVAYALQSVVAYLRQLRNGQTFDYSSLGWSSVRLWVDLYDAAAPIPLTEIERDRLPLEMLRIFLVSMITIANQTDAVQTMLEQEDDLKLYRWVAEQDSLFKA